MAVLADSGKRREFPSGAVRDIQKGKGRCDLLPLSVCADLLQSRTLLLIDTFMIIREERELFGAIESFVEESSEFTSMAHAILEAAHQFEDGAEKYGWRNWEKGLPIDSFIDSGVRHYLKWRDGMLDEPHHRAFVWNMLCAIWTLQNIGDIPLEETAQ